MVDVKPARFSGSIAVSQLARSEGGKRGRRRWDLIRYQTRQGFLRVRLGEKERGGGEEFVSPFFSLNTSGWRRLRGCDLGRIGRATSLAYPHSPRALDVGRAEGEEEKKKKGGGKTAR